jgi:hypothetical protein
MELRKLLKELKLDKMIDKDLDMWKDLDDSSLKKIQKSKYSQELYRIFYLKTAKDYSFKKLTPDEGLKVLEKESSEEYISKAANYLGTTRRGLWYYLVSAFNEYDEQSGFWFSPEKIDGDVTDISPNEDFMFKLKNPEYFLYINFMQKDLKYSLWPKKHFKNYGNDVNLAAVVNAGEPGKGKTYEFKSEEDKLTALFDLKEWLNMILRKIKTY